MKAIRLALFVAVLLFLASSLLLAQGSEGRILGTIADVSGAAISGATITVTNTATGVSRTTASSKAGEFVVPQLEAGPYSVKIQAKGFATVDRTGIHLEVAKDVRVDVQL
ncbi:MAG: carboxypeptidase-like regulatory domain-containing protein, partial [Terriglobales bacterium]